MPTSKTKELAKKLGLLKKRKAENVAGNSIKRRKGQLLSFVIVIDFESTCWKEKKGAQEIIEFPAVLLDLQTGVVMDEFQQYVQPQENPILSDFCKELTGISQAQVDGGVPLPTCLYLFGKWVRQLREERGVCLMEPGKQYSSHDTNLCALATWSDWDLGVCLQYECRRKQFRKPPYFDQWIDLRIVYKQFYDRKPSGLCGSLEDLGIRFTGREHCGLDDARNTAKLCYRMVKDGCRLNITKSLWKKRPVVRAPGALAEISKDSTTWTLASDHSSTVTAPTTVTCPSTTESNLEERRREDAQNLMRCKENTEAEPKRQKSAVREEDWVIESDENFLNGIIHEFEQFEKNNYMHPEVPNETTSNHQEPRCSSSTYQLANHTATTNQRKHTEVEITPSRSRFVSHITPVTLLPPTHLKRVTDEHQPQTNTHQQPLQQLQTVHSSSPHTTPAAHLSQQQQRQITSPLSFASTQKALHTPTATTCTPQKLSRATAAFELGNTSGMGNTAVVTPPTTAAPSVSFRTPSTTQWMKVKSSLSTSPSTPSLDSPQPFNGGKITPPLCNCGKRAKRKFVTSPGPNQGKPFFSCPGGREAGCQYFRWETSSPSAAHTLSSTVNLSSEYT